MDNCDTFKYGAVLALLKTHRALKFDLARFRACASGSLQEDELWKQCETRLQEIELYEGMIPSEVASLIMTHVLHSKDVKLWHK
jgi:hypothetical protein